MIDSTVEVSRFRDSKPWLSGRVPDGYWDSRENRVLYIDWLGQHLGFATQDDWYQVCNTDFVHNHGGALLWRVYNSSGHAAMQDYQPQYEWIPWLFAKTPKGVWEEVENRRAYMEWLGGVLQIRTEEDWYQVTKTSFLENRGSGLLRNYYGGSILAAVREYRPDYDWRPWLFPKVPNGFWNLPENRRRYLEWLASRHGFRSLSDWQGLTKQDLSETGAAGLFSGYYHGSLARLQNEVESMKLANGRKR